MTGPDHTAAAIHRQRAERHYAAASRFRQLGMTQSEDSARRAGRDEDEIAELLSFDPTKDGNHGR